MKVAICCKYFSPHGGQEQFFWGLARYLRDHSHQVEVITSRAEHLEGVSVKKVAPERFLVQAKRDWLVSCKLYETLQRTDYDVSIGGQKTWGCNIVRPGGGCEHTFWKTESRFRQHHAIKGLLGSVKLKRKLDLRAEAQAYTHPNLRCAVTNSKLVSSQLLVNYPTLKNRMHTIVNGVDLERFKPKTDNNAPENAEEKLRIIFVGNDFRRKGLPHVIDSLSQLTNFGENPCAELVVLGDDDPIQAMIQAESLGVSELTKFLGFKKNVEDHLAASDVLVLPTYFDACSNVVLEALACGVPAITTAANGAAEFIQHGYNGFIIPDAEQTYVLNANLSELRHPKRLIPMKAVARNSVEGHALQDKFASYEELLAFVAGADFTTELAIGA